MPKLPTYELQVRGGGGPYSSPDFINLSTPYANAISNVGSVLAKRGAQMLEEYDAAKAYEAFNVYSEQTRDKVQELRTREAGSVEGVQKDFDEFERTTRSKVESEVLTTPGQAALFVKLADHQRNSHLNTLAEHEFEQTKIYKGEQLKGLADTVERSMREEAFNEKAAREKMAQYAKARQRLFPGHDHSANIAAANEVFRFSQGKEIIAKNTKYAETWLEIPDVKKELGDKYDVLKKAMESQKVDNTVSGAIATLQSQYGTNYSAAIHWAEKAQNWGAAYDAKVASQVISYFNSMSARREHEEDRGRELHNRRQSDTFDKAYTQYLTAKPGDPVPDFDAMLKRGEISRRDYEHYKTGKETSKSDNPEVYGSYITRLARGEDIGRELVAETLLSDATKKSLLKANVEDRVKKAHADVKTAVDPGDLDRTPDRSLRSYDAGRKLDLRIAKGEDPIEAAEAVVTEYTIDLKRTWNTLPTTTRHLEGNRKDADAIDFAMKQAAAAFAAGRISKREYDDEIDTLNKMLKLTIRQQLVDDAEEKRRVEERKAGSKKPPGGKY